MKDKILFFIFTTAFVACMGAFVDVQLLKAEVRSNEELLRETLENTKWIRDRWIEKFGKE